MTGFADFTEKIRDGVGKTVGAGFRIKLNEVRKNNGVMLTGITVAENDSNISPTIYLNNYYQDYVNGKTTVANVVDDVISTYQKNKINQFVDMRYFLNYGNVRSRIIYKLINTGKNKELLEDIPHMEFLDLSIVFQCLVTQEDLGIASILIYNAHLKMWGVSVEDLYQAAHENTKSLLRHEIKSMSEVLHELMMETPIEEYPEDFRFDGDMPELAGSVPMYVLSNKRRVEGAACMLYPDLIHDFADKIGSNLFIIPSSIHELLLLPADRDEEAPEIKCMIRDINDSQVSTEEILSYSLYFYDRQVGEIIRL